MQINRQEVKKQIRLSSPDLQAQGVSPQREGGALDDLIDQVEEWINDLPWYLRLLLSDGVVEALLNRLGRLIKRLLSDVISDVN